LHLGLCGNLQRRIKPKETQNFCLSRAGGIWPVGSSCFRKEGLTTDTTDFTDGGGEKQKEDGEVWRTDWTNTDSHRQTLTGTDGQGVADGLGGGVVATAL
jgi:hypothetical protein